MRKLVCLCLIVMLLPLCAAFAEDTVSYRSVTVSRDAEYVDMGDTVITDGDFASFYLFLDQLPHLKKADMFATQVRANRIGEMTARYPEVEFGWSMVIGDHVVRTDQTAFSTLHNNRSPQHTEKDFELLKYCKNLLALDIGHNHVEDLSFLYDLPKLRVLIIGRNSITDITPVGSLKDLEYLEMFTLKVQDISPLAELHHLLDLNIAFNTVKDYTPLYGLTQLKRLWLYNSNNYLDSDRVPREVIDKLRQCMPDCEIDNFSHPTGGTWREHPHYFVIFDMFKSGTYIPFEDSQPLEQP